MVKLLDKLAARLTGLPVQVRFSLSPSLLLGRLPRGRIVINGVRAGGLFLQEVDVRVNGLALVSSWPPRIRVAHVEARIHLDQRSLDSWSKSVGLPVRLRLRPGRVVARTGIAGLRLSEADMDVQLEDRTLRLVPRRINVLGMETSGSRLGRIALPLPQLPRDARLESLEPEESALRARLSVDNLDEELTKERIQALRKMASSVMTPASKSQESAHDDDDGRGGIEDLQTRLLDNRSGQGRSSLGGPINGKTGTSRSRPRPASIIEATVLDIANVLPGDDSDAQHGKKPE